MSTIVPGLGPSPAHPPHRGAWRRYARWLEPLIGVLLFGLALAALHHELRDHGLREIAVTMSALPLSQLAAAVGLSVLDYFVLTLYDYMGVRYAGNPLPYRTVAPASFVSYALSHNLGLTALTGAPMRYRFYSAAGLRATAIARTVLFVSATFWFGIVTVGGAAFIIEPLRLPAALQRVFGDSGLLGVILLLVAVGYLAAVLFVRRPFRIRSFELQLPSPRLAALQMLIAPTDLVCAAAALYVLLPSGAGVSFPRFLTVYLLAIIVALISQVPGGLGVFETAVVLLLPTDLPGATVLATVLAYRAVYYIFPLFTAGGVLAVYEAVQRRARLGPLLAKARSWTAFLMPHVAAAIVFVAGAVLLFSGALPSLPHRLGRLGRVAPLALLELSHFLGSIIGLCLLLLARGLQRRLDSAYQVTLVLLGAGAMLSLAKGLDYEEALILGVVLLALLPSHRLFYRKGALLGERFTPGWLSAIAVVIGASIWLGFLSFRHVNYSSDLWWKFALHGDAPRFLRASVGVVILAVVLAFARLLRPTARQRAVPDELAMMKVEAIVARSPDASANLAFLGDKHVLFSADEEAFIMYDIEGRSWVALGGPVGPSASHRDVAWKFRSLVDRYDGWPVFYEVRPETLPLCVDLGLALLKLGEEALVPLPTFSLEGHSRKGLRHSRRRMEEDGCAFEIIPVAGVPELLTELRRVSDEWLAAKRAREKRFSIGFFDEAYLLRYPLAVVKRNRTIVAFANLWQAAEGAELSIDLMRHTRDAPAGVMVYLLTELMLWGKDAGYRRFNLGMAPMAGVEGHALAPLWNRIGAFLFQHVDEFYNFQGVRNFKEKFAPVWEPRYLASPGGLVLPRILANLATLIGGGVRGVFGK